MLPTYADMLPAYPYATCRLDIVSTSADTVFGCVANMSADMSATCRADTHVSVDSTIFLTFKNPTFSAKMPMKHMNVLKHSVYVQYGHGKQFEVAVSHHRDIMI